MDIEKTIRNLESNHMKGYYIDSREVLFTVLHSLIPEGSSIGCGDSVTLEQLGVFHHLRTGNYCFLDKHDSTLTSAQKRAIYIQNFSANTFITGSNAITEEGTIFNIDGNGSRVAPMLYGPKQVIIIVGVNKIVETVDDAIRRTRMLAAPLDAIRLGKKTPCAKTKTCWNCKHPQRICNDFVLITGQFDKNRIKVLIVNEELGY